MGSFLLRKYFETFSDEVGDGPEEVAGPDPLCCPLARIDPLTRADPLGRSRPLRTASAASTPNK